MVRRCRSFTYNSEAIARGWKSISTLGVAEFHPDRTRYDPTPNKFQQKQRQDAADGVRVHVYRQRTPPKCRKWLQHSHFSQIENPRFRFIGIIEKWNISNVLFW